MFAEQRLYEYGGLLAAGIGLYQVQKLHETEYEKAQQRHQEAINLTKQQHEKDLKIVKQTYLLQVFNSLEQHFQQLNADLIASSRESERDMFDQRNQSFQTIILASSVMFSALSSVIVEGTLPEHASDFLLIAYSLTSALSFAFLFLCIVFSMELVMRTSLFMYRRANRHTRTLRSAIDDTKKMMKKLRGEADYVHYRNSASREELVQEQNILSAADTSPTSPKSMASDGGTSNKRPQNGPQKLRRAISKMDPGALDNEWRRHEEEIRGYLKQREEINERTSTDLGNVKKRSFKDFWNESCKFWWDLAILFFYAGSLNLLLAIMIFMWGQFLLNYNSLVGAIVAVSLIGLMLVAGIATVIVMRQQTLSRNLHNIARTSSDIEAMMAAGLIDNNSELGREPNPFSQRHKLHHRDQQYEEGDSQRSRNGDLHRRWFKRKRALTADGSRDRHDSLQQPQHLAAAAVATTTVSNADAATTATAPTHKAPRTLGSAGRRGARGPGGPGGVVVNSHFNNTHHTHRSGYGSSEEEKTDEDWAMGQDIEAGLNSATYHLTDGRSTQQAVSSGSNVTVNSNRVPHTADRSRAIGLSVDSTATPAGFVSNAPPSPAPRSKVVSSAASFFAKHASWDDDSVDDVPDADNALNGPLSGIQQQNRANSSDSQMAGTAVNYNAGKPPIHPSTPPTHRERPSDNSVPSHSRSTDERRPLPLNLDMDSSMGSEQSNNNGSRRSSSILSTDSAGSGSVHSSSSSASRSRYRNRHRRVDRNAPLQQQQQQQQQSPQGRGGSVFRGVSLSPGKLFNNLRGSSSSSRNLHSRSRSRSNSNEHNQAADRRSPAAGNSRTATGSANGAGTAIRAEHSTDSLSTADTNNGGIWIV